MGDGDSEAVRMGAMKYLICLFFHKRYRVRTFDRMMRISARYEIKCSKCGNEDSELEFLRYRI